MRKEIVLWLLLLLGICHVNAQEPRKKFNPEQFQKDLEQYIATEAALTPQESEIFFPIYREMMRKQRLYFDRMKCYRHIDFTDEKACCVAIQKRDELDLEIKQLQREYHRKFMDKLPAGKVLRILQAEDRFHRQAFRKVAKDKKTH